jgi:hypothetical protein
MLRRVTSSSTFAPVTLSLAKFNELSDIDCLSLLRSFLDVQSWAIQLCNARPYAALDDLIAAAAAQGAGITPAEVVGALDRHPRIGARLSDGSRESAWSAREQAGVQGDDAASSIWCAPPAARRANSSTCCTAVSIMNVTTRSPSYAANCSPSPNSGFVL